MSGRSRIWIACAIAMLAGPACRPDPPPDVALVASRYIHLVRALARHDPSLVDHWLTPMPPDDGPRQPVMAIRAEIDRLASDVANVLPRLGQPEVMRARHLDGQVRALQLAARRLLGESLPFDTEARLGLGLDRARPNVVRIEGARTALESELRGEGPLAERLRAFRAGFEVVEARREATLRAALGACREATATHLTLPADEGLELELVAGLPWDAHARYLGNHRTRIAVNATPPLDLARALRVACHEGYPGHHLQYIWMADVLVGERGWTEFGLVPGFGPDLLVAEGAAEAGAAFVIGPEQRAGIYATVLAPAAGMARTTEDFARLGRVEALLAEVEPVIGDIAAAYLDSRANGAATEARLSEEALLPDAEAFLLFIERRRARLLAYPEGRRLVHDRLARTGLPGLRDLFTSAAMTLD